MSAPPIDLFTRLARTGVRLNIEPKGWERAALMRFWRVEDDTLVLKLETGLREGESFEADQPFWAVFENVGRIRTFTTTIIEVLRKPDDSIAAIRCRLPAEIRSDDRRRAFRVPKVLPFVLRASLHAGDESWECTVSNISVLGVMLQFSEAVAATLRDDVAYKIRLETFEGNADVGARLVRQARNGGIAFRFPSSIKMGDVAPSPELAKVVRVAELVWLRRSKGTDKQSDAA